MDVDRRFCILFVVHVTHSNYATKKNEKNRREKNRNETKSDNGPKMDYGPYHKCFKRYKTDPFKLGYINYLLVKMWSHWIRLSELVDSFVAFVAFQVAFVHWKFSILKADIDRTHYGSLSQQMYPSKLIHSGHDATTIKVVFNG